MSSPGLRSVSRGLSASRCQTHSPSELFKDDVSRTLKQREHPFNGGGGPEMVQHLKGAQVPGDDGSVGAGRRRIRLGGGVGGNGRVTNREVT